MLSVIDLSPLNIVPRDHVLIVLKGYFDGGNQSDSSQYAHLTLAGISGRTKDWRAFDAQWKRVLIKHGVKNGLHTTDAIGLKNDFAQWNASRVDDLLEDLASTILSNASISGARGGTARIGLRPVTATVNLKDFIEALKVVPGIGTPEEN